MSLWLGFERNGDDELGSFPFWNTHYYHALGLFHWIKVLLMYTVDGQGKLRPNKQHICVRFKTESARDLALGRSGEGFGARGKWPSTTVSVQKGPPSCIDGPDLFLLVLPDGRSVEDVLQQAAARLPAQLALRPLKYEALTRGGGRVALERIRARRKEVEIHRDWLIEAAHTALIGQVSIAGASDCHPPGSDDNNAYRVASLATKEADWMLEQLWNLELQQLRGRPRWQAEE
ncbi:unnamed protein product [Choristocarpus tenellus]